MFVHSHRMSPYFVHRLIGYLIDRFPFVKNIEKAEILLLIILFWNIMLLVVYKKV